MSLFSQNYKYIESNTNCDIKSGYCSYNYPYELINSKEKTPSVFIRFSDKKLSLHSNYYPSAEATRQVDKFTSTMPYIVVMGLGMAYHISALACKYPHKKIIVVEPDKHLFNIFLQNFDLHNFANIDFIIGSYEYEVAKKLKNISQLDIFFTNSLFSLHKKYYDLLINRLTNKQVKQFSDRWQYPKFKDSVHRVLFIDSGYVLTKECLDSIELAGHSYRYLHLDKENYHYPEFLKAILRIIDEFRPDFILTVNHMGFDKEGMLTEVLTQLNLPFVSWFVDSPTVVLSSHQENISDYCNIFVWDRDYINDIKENGYPHVDYLPLAAFPPLFKPLNLPATIDVGFVGSSMVFAIHKNIKSFLHRPALMMLLEITAQRFLKINSRIVEDAINELNKEGHLYTWDNLEQKEDFKAATLWRSTQIYRLSGISQLAEFYPLICGDPHWEMFVDNRFRIRREIDYYQQMPHYYNSCKIQFNMTSRQMKNAVNQRVFDVPSCGSLVISDYKSQLDEIFAPDEMVYFKETGEIKDLVRHYLADDKARQTIANKARMRLLNGHTYVDRINTMILIIKKRYKD